MTHISTAYEPLKLAGSPAELRLERVGFPDGSTLYLLYLNLEQSRAVVVPKGVKMALTLSGGKVVRLQQIGQQSATPRRQENGSFLTRLKYAAEPDDLEQMLKGVKAADIITGWDPDDYLQATFPADEFSALLRRQAEAIRESADHTLDLEAGLSGYTENTNSILSTAQPIVARGTSFDYNILLSHLYYKDTNGEDLDLAFVIGTQEKYHIPFDAEVCFTLGDGSEIRLRQARDDVNFVYLYPAVEDLFRMVSAGVSALSIDCEGARLEDSFVPAEGGESFSQAVNQQLQLLLSLSPR
jgi:hypothetical protein